MIMKIKRSPPASLVPWVLGPAEVLPGLLELRLRRLRRRFFSFRLFQSLVRTLTWREKTDILLTPLTSCSSLF